MTESFNTYIKPIGKILEEGNLEVPPYQRAYSWTEEAKIYIEDIISNKNINNKYFIGAMVFIEKEEVNKDNRLIKKVIIDGQQRLITTEIILIALRDLCHQYNIKYENRNYCDWFTNLIINPNRPPDEEIKPTLIVNKIDQHFYNFLVNEINNIHEKKKMATTLIKSKNIHSWKNLWKTYEYAIEHLTKIIFRDITNNDKDTQNINEEKIKEKIKKIIENIIKNNIYAVIIEVSSEENAYLVFETLNAKGLKLTPLDLIKNHLYKILEDETEVTRVDAIWENIIEKINNPSELLKYVIRYYLIISTQQIIRENEIFKIIKNKIKQKKDVLQFIKDIKIMTDRYIQIVEPDKSTWKNEKIISYLYDLQEINIKQHIPLIYILLEQKINENVLKEYIHHLYTTLIKRSIIKKSPSEFEKTLPELIKYIKENNIERYKEKLSVISPSKEEIKDAIETMSFESRSQRKLAKILLRRIENYHLKKEEYITSTDLWLEHIHPESKENELNTPKKVHKLGNLTLLESGDNKEASDKPFNEKKEIYEKSILKINQKLINQYDQWDEKTIDKRTEELIEIITNIFFE